MVSFRATSAPFKSSPGWGSCVARVRVSVSIKDLSERSDREAFSARDADYRGKAWSGWVPGREFVEDVAHRSREYTFDFGDLNTTRKT